MDQPVRAGTPSALDPKTSLRLGDCHASAYATLSLNSCTVGGIPGILEILEILTGMLHGPFPP